MIFRNCAVFFARVSSPQGVVVLSAGDVKQAEFMRIAEKKLRDLPVASAIEMRSSHFRSGETVFVEPPSDKKLSLPEQPVGLIARFQAVPESSPMRFAFSVLCNMLSSGLDSPLMTELREKRGLVYGIRAGADLWGNDGNIQFSMNTSRSNIEQSARVLADTLGAYRTYLTPERFERTRASVLFAFADQIEAPDDWAHRAVNDLRVHGRVRDYAEMVDGYRGITLFDVHRAAEIAFGKSPFVAVQGPVEGLEFKPVFDRALKL